jgi:hypothetical protein
VIFVVFEHIQIQDQWIVVERLVLLVDLIVILMYDVGEFCDVVDGFRYDFPGSNTIIVLHADYVTRRYEYEGLTVSK